MNSWSGTPPLPTGSSALSRLPTSDAPPSRKPQTLRVNPMRLWQSRQTVAKVKREIRQAEVERRRAHEHQAGVDAKDPVVQRLVAQLARHRQTGRIADRIEALFAEQQVRTQTAADISSFVQDLRIESQRMQDGRREGNDGRRGTT